MSQDFGVSITFNVIDLTPCDAKEEDDAYMEWETLTLEGLRGSKRKYDTIWSPSRTKEKSKEAMLCV
ncbi:hypothetical protein CR513_36621, partial [Mucuna pruriens]